MRKTRTFCVALATGLSLSSCGSGKPSDADAASIASGGTATVATSSAEVDTCSLLSAEKATAITIVKVNQVKPWGDKQSCK